MQVVVCVIRVAYVVLGGRLNELLLEVGDRTRRRVVHRAVVGVALVGDVCARPRCLYCGHRVVVVWFGCWLCSTVGLVIRTMVTAKKKTREKIEIYFPLLFFL